MRHKARDSGAKYAMLLLLCRHIGLLFDKRLDTNLLRHRNLKYPDSPVHTLSDSLRIFFPLWRADLKISWFAVEFAGWVWTVAVSAKKKLRIQNYPDTCGRDYFMESARVWYLRTSFLIQKQRVRWYPTKHFLCCNLFILYLLRFSPSTRFFTLHSAECFYSVSVQALCRFFWKT